MRAGGKFVNQLRHYFFAGAAFAQHQHRDIHMGDQRSLRPQLPHGRAGSDEESFIADFLNFAGIVLLIRAQALVNDRVQFGFLEGLRDVVGRSQPNSLHNFFRVIHAGKHHHANVWLQLA